MSEKIRGKTTMMNILKENSSDRRKKSLTDEERIKESELFRKLETAIREYFN